MGACEKSSYCEYLSTNICCYECKKLGLHKGKYKNNFNGWNYEEDESKIECNIDTENGQCRIFNRKYIETPEGKCDYIKCYENTDIISKSYTLDKENFNCPYYREYSTLKTVTSLNDIVPCKECPRYIPIEKKDCDTCWKSKRSIPSLLCLAPISHEDCWTCEWDYAEGNDTNGFNPSKWECKDLSICKRCYEMGKISK